MELEEELKVVGNSLKSLEVSEEKANQRVEEFKKQLKSLTVKLKEAEARAEFAEKTVKKLQKEVDRLEGALSAFYALPLYFNALLLAFAFYRFRFQGKEQVHRHRHRYRQDVCRNVLVGTEEVDFFIFQASHCFVCLVLIFILSSLPPLRLGYIHSLKVKVPKITQRFLTTP